MNCRIAFFVIFVSLLSISLPCHIFSNALRESALYPRGVDDSHFQSGRNLLYMSNRIKTNCNVCGKKMHVIPSRIKRGRGKYCSVKCKSKETGKSESENGHWKGDRSGV